MRKKHENPMYNDEILQYKTQSKNTLYPFNDEYEKTPFVFGKDFSCSNIIWEPMTMDMEINIPIPEGYQVVPGKQMSVQTSFDQHNITPVVIKEEVVTELNIADEANNVINMDACVDIYKIKLVGNLYYNSVVSNMEPIGSISSKKDTKFNVYGGIVFNNIIAYVDDIDEVPRDIKESLTYNMIVNSIKINSMDTSSTNSSIMAQDLNNFGSMVTVSMTMVVTSNQGPIS